MYTHEIVCMNICAYIHLFSIFLIGPRKNNTWVSMPFTTKINQDSFEKCLLLGLE